MRTEYLVLLKPFQQERFLFHNPPQSPVVSPADTIEGYRGRYFDIHKMRMILNGLPDKIIDTGVLCQIEFLFQLDKP
jgi:hypothetical protein